MSNIDPRAGAAKKLDPLKTHDGMASMTRGDTLGGPTQGDPPDHPARCRPIMRSNTPARPFPFRRSIRP